jgi:hypothetical protein
LLSYGSSDSSVFIEDFFSEFSDILVTMLRYPSWFEPHLPGLQPFQFRGGRYAVAKCLTGMVSFAGNFSLGQLCRFVQLAIDRGILAYENNLLQPPAACTALSSAVFSKLNLPLSDDEDEDEGADSGRVVASLLELSNAVGLLMQSCRHGEGILLSTLKKRMVEEFGKSLRPTTLGFTKLLDLMIYEKSLPCAVYRDDRNHKIFLFPSTAQPPAGLMRLR